MTNQKINSQIEVIKKINKQTKKLRRQIEAIYYLNPPVPKIPCQTYASTKN